MVVYTYNLNHSESSSGESGSSPALAKVEDPIYKQTKA
jgi:hypothetical protein